MNAVQTVAFAKDTDASLRDEQTGSWHYVLTDKAWNKAAIIDLVLDFVPNAGTTPGNADKLLEHIERHGLTVKWISTPIRTPLKRARSRRRRSCSRKRHGPNLLGQKWPLST